MNGPTQQQVADQIMILAICGGREGTEMDAAGRDDEQYMDALNAAESVLALFAHSVQAFRAEAWDEGQEATLRDFNHQGKRMRVTPNPYREATP